MTLSEPGIELGIELGFDEPARRSALSEDMLFPLGLNLAKLDCWDMARMVCSREDSCEILFKFGEACLTIELQLT